MRKESIEEYLGTIYRLQEVIPAPLPLPRLQERLNYSPISIHEMVLKLEKQALVDYVPYRGVTLTAIGKKVAAALVRRHRIWERFLTDSLGIGWENAHEIAGELEHAAPELVTERLADFLGDPQQCPHGSQIPASPQEAAGEPDGAQPVPPPFCLDALAVGQKARVAFISLEVPENLLALQSQGIKPGVEIELVGRQESTVIVQVAGNHAHLPAELAETIWLATL